MLDNAAVQGFDTGIGINLTRRQLDEGTFIDTMKEAQPWFVDKNVDLTLEVIARCLVVV